MISLPVSSLTIRLLCASHTFELIGLLPHAEHIFHPLLLEPLRPPITKLAFIIEKDTKILSFVLDVHIIARRRLSVAGREMQFVATTLSVDAHRAGLLIEVTIVGVDPVALVCEQVLDSVIVHELVQIDVALRAFADNVLVRQVGGLVMLQSGIIWICFALEYGGAMTIDSLCPLATLVRVEDDEEVLAAVYVEGHSPFALIIWK